MENKRNLGQYFTMTNPFVLEPFVKWFNSIPNIENEILLEPYAGANNIVKMLGTDNKWVCYDYEPPKENVCSQFPVIQRDTIENFPTGFKAAITNPPYLAKNSATRRGLKYQGGEYDDTYKKTLEIMLANCEYVAAIIPESFITAGLFHERLCTVISLTCKMFDDTDCPVCLALFNKEASNDFEIYKMEKRLGTYNELSVYLPNQDGISKVKVTFNDPNGEIGIKCVDSTSGPSIEFVEGGTIDKSKIKVSSRALTRVSLSCPVENRGKLLSKCNDILNEYRNKTSDVFLTSFKGLRKDGMYRRRLDFLTAKNVILEALKNE